MKSSMQGTIDGLVKLKTWDEICRAAPQIRQLIDDFASASEDEQSAALQSITSHHSWTLLGYARLAAEVAVRESSVDELRRGLLAIVLERTAGDFRDTLHVIALLYHSCRKIGADPNELFRDASDLAEAQVADLLIGFLRRSAPERELSRWRYREGSGPDGFRYESTEPKVDLSDWMDKKP